MNFRDFFGKTKQETEQQSKVIWSKDYVTEQVSKLTLGDYRDPERFQLQLGRVLTELCCMHEGKEVGDEKFEDLVKECTCQKQLVDIMQEYAIQAIQCYLCQFRGNNYNAKNAFSNILAVLFVIRSAFEFNEIPSYESIASAIIDYDYSYEEIPWSFAHFENVFEYSLDRCYNKFFEVRVGTMIANIWYSHMLQFVGNAFEEDINFLKRVTIQKCMPIDWGNYFHEEAQKLSQIWTACEYNSCWTARDIAECFPELTSDVYKAALLRLIKNPDKYLLVLGTDQEIEDEFYSLPENELYLDDEDDDCCDCENEEEIFHDSALLCDGCCAGDECEEDVIEDYPIALSSCRARRDFIWMFEKMLEVMYDLNKYQSVEFAISDHWEEILSVAYNYTNGSVLTFAAEVLEKAFHVSKDTIEDYIAATTYEKIRDWNAWARIDGNDVTKNWENGKKLRISIDNHDVVPEASFQLINLLSNPIVFKIVDRENPYIVPSFNV